MKHFLFAATLLCFSPFQIALHAKPSAKPVARPTHFWTLGVHEIGARLIVPSIYLDAPIVEGIDDPALRVGPGHDSLSDLPGKAGNCVIAAHRNVWGAWFWHLPRVKVGETIEVRTRTQRQFYRVTRAQTMSGYDTSVLEPPLDPTITRLTLYTCTKPKTDNRFVVVADLIRTQPSTARDFQAFSLPQAKPQAFAARR